MTFRAKPVATRPRRASHDDRGRRNLYLNVGFGIAVALAVVILVGVGGVSWYREHLLAAASVNGQSITRDEFKARASLEIWRLDQQVARVNEALRAGRLTSAEASQSIQTITNQTATATLYPKIVEGLVDARIQAGLAQAAGITVTPAQIDAKIAAESTTPEERHVWVIAVKPQVDTGKTIPTDAQKVAAKKIADQALTDITTGGKKWEDVAKAVSTDSSKATGGDIGWIDKNAAEDQPFLDAVFAAAQDKPSSVVIGIDGTYRIGRVTEISPATVDPAWITKLTDAGHTVDAYRKVIEAEVIRQSLEDKVLADVTKSDKQRDVLEIAIQAPQAPPSAKAIKVRHILFSPNHDPTAASSVAADDPAWTTAKLAAQKAYDDLKKDPSKFDAMARSLSDESSAKGETGTGGKLPYVDDTGTFVKEFADAVLKDGLKAGDLLEPIKTSFGWHVIQVMYRPPDLDQMKKLRDQIAAGADFGTLARDNSESSESGKGGALGWVVKGQLDDRQTAAIFAAPVGGLSDIVEIKAGGIFLFKVLSEKTSLPDATQLAMLKNGAFQNWYRQKKDAVTITRDILTDAGLTTP